MMRGRGFAGHRITGAKGPTGSILIEVVVAVLLVGVLVGELAAAFLSSMDRAAQVDVQALALGKESAVTARDPWDWGPSVSSLSWEGGPVLRLGISQRERAGELVAGLWSDGWFLGEHELASDGGLTVEGATWEGRQGRELVLRVRDRDGTWGPPWRTVIPDVYGDIRGEQVAPLPAAEDADPLSGQATAVHLPSLATAALEASWSGRPQQASGIGEPVFLLPSTSGLCDVGVTGDLQTWRREAGRVLDVYF